MRLFGCKRLLNRQIVKQGLKSEVIVAINENNRAIAILASEMKRRKQARKASTTNDDGFRVMMLPHITM